MAYPDGMTDYEKVIIILAGIMDIQRQALVCNDIERAREKLKKLDVKFGKYFLKPDDENVPRAFPVEAAQEIDGDIPW